MQQPHLFDSHSPASLLWMKWMALDQDLVASDPPWTPKFLNCQGCQAGKCMKPCDLQLNLRIGQIVVLFRSLKFTLPNLTSYTIYWCTLEAFLKQSRGSVKLHQILQYQLTWTWLCRRIIGLNRRSMPSNGLSSFSP